MASSTTSSSSWVDFLPLIAFVLVALLIWFSGKTKKLKCPECGNIFDSPALDNKNSGSGSTLPGMGTVKCPRCGKSRPRKEYTKVKAKEPKYDGVLRPEGSAPPPST